MQRSPDSEQNAVFAECGAKRHFGQGTAFDNERELGNLHGSKKFRLHEGSGESLRQRGTRVCRAGPDGARMDDISFDNVTQETDGDRDGQ